MKKKDVSEKTTTFNVAVFATMSAGKSTIINALLGHDFLPSKNEACTAKIFKIKDVDGLTQFSGRTKDENNKWSELEPINTDILNDWNSSEIKEIEIQGDFPHINNLAHGEKILFYDTPGPNNSVDKSHAEISKNILNSSGYGFILFVINATQFGVDDERSFLEPLLARLNQNNKKHRIVFIVNKIDQLDIELGETPVDLIRKVKAYLSEIGFSNPVIVPAFAQMSLRIREILNRHAEGKELNLSKRQQKRFVRDFETLKNNSEHYFDIYLSEHRFLASFQNALEKKRVGIENTGINIGEEKFETNDLIWGDLATGIPVVEEYLENELNNHFARIHVKDLISCLKEHLHGCQRSS